MARDQECSTPGCGRPAAFATRTRPAWCEPCIDEKYRQKGLEPLERFDTPRAWRLTRCASCGVEAHYRFEYILTNGDPKTCRACYWVDWARHARQMAGHDYQQRLLNRLRNEPMEAVRSSPLSCEELAFLDEGLWTRERIVDFLAENGFDLVDTVVKHTTASDPVVSRCRRCGRLTAERLSDVGWGCSCRQNKRSQHPENKTPRRQLFCDSNLPARQWWDHERNTEKDYRTATVLARRECWWVCPDCGHQFTAQVKKMAERPECPVCEQKRRDEWAAEHARLKTLTIAQVPELKAAFAEEALDPQDVPVDTMAMVRFRCPAGHHPRVSPITYLNAGCQFCRATTPKGERSLAKVQPEIAAQWHETRNGALTPENVVWTSKRSAWWRAECCGTEWQERICDRDKYDRMRCRTCDTILGSLAWHDPGLAAEWDTLNPMTAWQVRPQASPTFTPWWVCSVDPSHRWQAPLASRAVGAGCPDCREAGKSRVELDHLEAAQAQFGSARSGLTVRSTAFKTRPSWTVDIVAEAGGKHLAIEYDGAYWHGPQAKQLVDERKSHDLLAAGYLVVRLREDGLPPLPVSDPGYCEIAVYSTAPRPTETIRQVSDWVASLT